MNDSDKLKSEISPGRKLLERPRIHMTELLTLNKNKSNNNNLRSPGTPLMKRSNDSDSLVEDSFFRDYKESENTPVNKKSSRKSSEEI